MAKDEMAWLQGSFVGTTRDLEGILSTRKKFQLEALLSMRLTPMGGNMVLIRAFEGDNFENILKSNRGPHVWWLNKGQSG